MNQKILGLRPKRYLCPYCGKWQKSELWEELGYYDSRSYKAEFFCENCNTDAMKIFFSDGYCYYETAFECDAVHFEINNNIQIEKFVLSSTEPHVTFNIPFYAKKEIREACSNCNFKEDCTLCKLLNEDNSRDKNITFGFEFEQSDYDKMFKSDILARKETELQEREKNVKSKEQYLMEREGAMKAKEHEQKEIKEDATMKNNTFNMNLEFGPNKDENIASTLMGIAVKNGDNWRIYDKKKKEITDVGDIQLGNLPIFILPTTKLNEGDLIKDNIEYYYVMKVEKESTQTLCAKTGEMKTIIPIKNVLGFSCYSKVSTLSNLINVGDDLDVEKLALMSAMYGQNGEDNSQMSQLLPLMLFKDKLGGDNDVMKLALMSSMMSTQAEGGGQSATMKQILPLMLFKDELDGDDDVTKLALMSTMCGQNGEGNSQMSQLLPLMLFKDELGGDDDVMKIALMTSMMGSSKAGSNNPTMGYLMLNKLMGKKEKDEEVPNDDYDEELNDDLWKDDNKK